MWSLLVFLYFAITWAAAQNGRGPQHQDHNGHGWDIRLAVPGEPGSDYPTLGAIPRTTFSCAGREPGYYADLETNCQVFRVCTVGSTYGFQSFLCPNGTLFNQAVFVCDWWMNVDCKNSQQFISNNNEKFENLKLGPQLMKDIKKMLTHPMLNPYDKSTMKSNLIVMQDYKPPIGQLFPNGALLAGPERPPNNVYVPSKQIQQNFIQSNDYTYSASTPDPRYLPAPVNSNFGLFQSNDDFFQRQRQSEQNIRNGRIQSPQNNNFVSNSHAGRFIQNSNSDLNNINAYSQVSQAPRPTQVSNFSQRQMNIGQTSQTSNVQNNQRGQANKQRAQYNEPRKTGQSNNEKESDFGVTFTKPQNNRNADTNQDKQPYGYSTPSASLPQFSNTVSGKAGRELKENLVSTIKDIPTTVVTKTYSRIIQETKVAKPKSRVTIKTWIVKPTKSGRQLADPTPYTYPRTSPTSPSPTARLIAETTPYVYEKPTTLSQTEKIISTELDSEEPYVYTKPTMAAKQIQTTEFQTTRIYIAPTTKPTRPTFSGRLNLSPTSSLPTKASRYYLTPSPFKTSDRLYLPPPRNPTVLPRLYLSPNDIPQPVYYQNAQLRASPTIPSPTLVAFNENLNQPSFSRMNANHNNLSFADILTKEKLDITVNDIVKDTDDILKTASPPQTSQYRKTLKSLEYHEGGYVPKKTTIDSGERLTSQSPLQSRTIFSKSSRLIATPATSLVPPDESFIYQNTNQLSRLPYYKESGFPNTIERTVSIKITIPERIAMYLFQNQSESEYDKLEILNTGSSNYLVLSNNNNNNLLTKKNTFSFIPIAKLSENNNINNISDSQALVYSFLTDSINVAREYSNIAQQEILSSTVTPTPAQFQNLNNEQISDITNQISQLTSSQFSSNNFNNIGKSSRLISSHSVDSNQPIPFTGNLKLSNEQNRARQLQTPLYNVVPVQQTQGQFYSSQYQIPNQQQNQLNNQNEVYSGQLYQWSVPEVTNQIYNRPASANLVNPNTIQQQTTQMLTLQRNTNQNSAADNLKQSSPGVEIIKAQTLPFSTAKLQLEPPNQSGQFTSQESLTNLLNTENGISAQLQDKIVGTIPHPLEENKLVTYKKDQSYYLYTKLDGNTIEQNVPSNIQGMTSTQQNAKSNENTNVSDQVTFQLIPSVNYELEDEKEQQEILNAFQIDEFGAPREISKPNTLTENKTERQIMTSSVDFSVEHPTASRRSDRYRIDGLYSGPSSYTAPQSSVGSLERRQSTQNNFNSRIEDFNSNDEIGYPKERPARQFIF